MKATALLAATVVLSASNVAGETRTAADAKIATAATARVVATAIPPATAIRVDGDLTEEVWQRAPVITGFKQRDPRDGDPALSLVG